VDSMHDRSISFNGDASKVDVLRVDDTGACPQFFLCGCPIKNQVSTHCSCVVTSLNMIFWKALII